MSNMVRTYGPDKGKNVFYALANKKGGVKPAFGGDEGAPEYDESEVGPMPTPPQRPSIMTPAFDASPAASMGAVPPIGTPPKLPTPPQAAGSSGVPSPVFNTVGSGETPVENPMPTPFQSQIGQGPMAKAASQAGQDYIKEANKKTPWWKEALGVTIGTLGLPQVGGKLTGDDEKRKALQKAVSLSALSDEERKQQTGAEASDLNKQRIQSEVENRATQADIRRTNALTRQSAVEASQQHIKELQSGQVRKWVEDQIGKSRQEDASYQAKSAQLPDRWEFIENPEKPGEGWAVPPSWSPLPAELALHAPGYKVGELTPHSILKQASKDYNALNLAKVKEESKNDPNATLDTKVRTAIASFGGDPRNAGDIAKGMKMVQDNEVKVAGSKQADKPLQVLTPDPNTPGGFKLNSVSPGGTVAPGSISGSGLNTTNIPTANTRTMTEKAPRVIQFVDRINQLIQQNEQQLGPLKSRWNEFTAGKVGLPNKGYTQLRTDVGLLETALMNMHVGARGGTEIMKHFHDLIDSSKQDPENLKAALGEIKEYATRVRDEGKPQNAQPTVKTWNPSTNTFE